jgi:RNA binding exosome subunit
VTDTLREHLRKAGQKGGLKKGKAKVRGDAAYYQRISKQAAAARKAKRARK